MDHDLTAREAARRYLDSGIVPVPVKHGSKRPAVAKWQNLNLDMNLDEMFPEGEKLNVGVLLGEASGELVDIDCDCPEAIAVAKSLLHAASVKSGRGEDEASHYWFRVKEGAPERTMRFEDPVKPGAVVLELRSNGGQTVVPPSRHPDGSPYKWIRDITEPEVINDITQDELTRVVGYIAAGAMLARYWPNKGSRHYAHLSLCGALLRHPDTGKVNEEWMDDVAGFVRVVAAVGGDRDFYTREENIDTTIENLEAGHPVRGWTSLTEYIPAPVVWQAREWLGLTPTDAPDEEDLTEWEDEEPEDLDDAWHRAYIGKAIIEGVDEPEELIPGTGLLYKGEVTTIQSAGGSGKTLIAMNLLWRAIQLGRKVLFVDEENGIKEVARRFMSFDVDPVKLDEGLIYFAMPSVNWLDPVNPERLLDLCEREDVDLVLIDSVMDMMASSGLDENDNSEFTQLYNRTIKRLKNAGRTVLLLDHVAKGYQKMARGASSKFDQSSVVWGVAVNQQFDQYNSGSVVLGRRKGRLAAVVNEVLVTINVDGKGSTRIDFIPDLKITSGKEEERESDMHEDVVIALTELGATSRGKAVSKRAVRDEINKDNNSVNEYLDSPRWPVCSEKVHARLVQVWLDMDEEE